MEGIKWNMPTYRQGETTLYIHDEKDLDLLISTATDEWQPTFNASKKLSLTQEKS